MWRVVFWNSGAESYPPSPPSLAFAGKGVLHGQEKILGASAQPGWAELG